MIARLNCAAASLRRTAEGIYGRLDDRTVQGRDFVRHRYSWDTVGRQMEEAYRQVIEK